MWIVEGVSSDVPFQKVIVAKQTAIDKTKFQPFVIGRKDGDLVFANDRRTSRVHAHLNILPSKDNPQSSKITITDLSKFGTLVNDKKILKNSKIELKHNDRICVGQPHSSFTLIWKPFIVCTSQFGVKEKKTIETLTNAIGMF